MRIEVVEHDTNAFRLRVVHVYELLHLGREVQLRARSVTLTWRHPPKGSTAMKGIEDWEGEADFEAFPR